jgi:hypothetical protein
MKIQLYKKNTIVLYCIKCLNNKGNELLNYIVGLYL